MKIIEDEINLLEEELYCQDGQIEENNLVTTRKEKVFFSLESCYFPVNFYWDNDYDIASLKSYKKNKTVINITLVILVIAIIAMVIAFISLIFQQDFVRFMWVGGITFVVLMVSGGVFEATRQKNRLLMFEYVLYDLKRRGARITYSNSTTGTISYKFNKVKKQISVFRGYNSHAK